MEKLMLRPEEAATLIGVSRSKLYQLVRAGELPSRRVGKSIRIPSHELLRWAGVSDPHTTATSGDAGKAANRLTTARPQRSAEQRA